MKIKDLPEPYKSMALKNKDLQWNKLDEEKGLDNLRSEGGFIWDDTPEGYIFWSDVYEGKLPTIPKQIKPELKSDQLSKRSLLAKDFFIELLKLLKETPYGELMDKSFELADEFLKKEI